jgi:hypothetical protein
MPIDRHGNVYAEPKKIKLEQDKCEVTKCHSNSGFSCTLSVYDHKDAINPESCAHRRFMLRNKK